MTAAETAIELATRDGHVTPVRLHERTGCAINYAYRLLSQMAADGILRRTRQGIYSIREANQ